MKTGEVPRIRNVAGIVPVVSSPTDYNLDWDSCLVPIAPNFYAIERAVLECAYAGCSTIWIVANDDTAPLIRYRIGDYVEDPVYLRRKSRFPSLARKQISVFYVPTPCRHKNKEGSAAWPILYGAKTAFGVVEELSKWVAPKKFYVAFPHGIYPADAIRPHRSEMARENNFSFTHRGESVLTGNLLGFTFTDEQMEEAIEKFKNSNTSVFFDDDPERERKYYFDNFSLDKVFESVFSSDKIEIELSWFYQINSWDGYCEYLSSEERKQVRHPGKLVMSYREWNPIGTDSEKELDEDT